jgi:hypothetical protein
LKRSRSRTCVNGAVRVRVFVGSGR